MPHTTLSGTTNLFVASDGARSGTRACHVQQSDTAVTSCAGANGFCNRTLFGTPWEAHCSAAAPVIGTVSKLQQKWLRGGATPDLCEMDCTTRKAILPGRLRQYRKNRWLRRLAAPDSCD